MDIQAFEQLMSVAIQREIEAYEFYRDVAKKALDPEVKKTFEQLSGEEMGHQELLEQFKGDPTMVMRINAPSVDTKVAEATELPKLTVNAKPADAIALAMKKEQQAVEFYRGLSVKSDDAEIKGVFSNLANMELNHKNRLENLFVQIGYPESF